MLIFFQWYGSDSSIADHVGIVEKVENGRVYTIEGNANDQVRQNTYPMDTEKSKGTACPLQTRKDDDYKTAGLFAAPPQRRAWSCSREYGYYTLTSNRTFKSPAPQARRAVRSVTGTAPVAFAALLEQEVHRPAARRPAPAADGPGTREGTSHADLSKICAFHADAVPTWEPRPFTFQRSSRRPVPDGTMGTLTEVDAAGRFLVNWDNGKRTALNLEDDRFRIFQIRTQWS